MLPCSVALQTLLQSKLCWGVLTVGALPHHVTSRAAQLATSFCMLDQQPLPPCGRPGPVSSLLLGQVEAHSCSRQACKPCKATSLSPCRLAATVGLLAGHTLSLTPPPQAGDSNQETAAGQPADFQAAASHLLLWCLEVLGNVVGRTRQPDSDQSTSSLMDIFGSFDIVAGLVSECVGAGGPIA